MQNYKTIWHLIIRYFMNASTSFSSSLSCQVAEGPTGGAIVERVESEAVEESSFVLSLSNNEWNFGEFALHQKVFWCVRKDVSINIWSKPPRERKEQLKKITTTSLRTVYMIQSIFQLSFPIYLENKYFFVYRQNNFWTAFL